MGEKTHHKVIHTYVVIHTLFKFYWFIFQYVSNKSFNCGEKLQLNHDPVFLNSSPSIQHTHLYNLKTKPFYLVNKVQ